MELAGRWRNTSPVSKPRDGLGQYPLLSCPCLDGQSDKIMTNDMLRAARGITLGVVIGGIMYAIFVVCILFASGVVTW